jgi:hypothetical protein
MKDSYDRLLKLGQEKYSISVKFKDKSLLMKALGKLLFFNPNFMKSYITTLGNTIYFPTEEWLKNNRDSAAASMAHELVHVSDSKEIGLVIFSYTYLFPQVISLLSLFALGGSSLLWLLFLVFLVPIPSPLRTYWELRGYAMSDAVRYKTTGNFLPNEFIEKQFLTSAYFWMWPFKEDLQARVNRNRELIVSGKLSLKIDAADEILNCF